MSKKITVICAHCSKEKVIFPSLCKGKMSFCNNICKAEFQKNNLSGNNNPNYGNKWSEEQRINASKTHTERFKDPNNRFMAGSANRGKKFDQARIEKMHANRTRESYNIKPRSEHTKKLIGKKSSEKWTAEYRHRNRQSRERLGQWVKLEDKKDRDIYFNASNWTKSKKPERDIFKLITNPACISYLEQLGKFNPHANNTTGVVRDHIFCRADGLQYKVFPEILRHPANCQLLPHADNLSKKTKRYRDRSDLTLQQLFDKIENYTEQWFEHEFVLQKIQAYKNGERWYNEHNKEESNVSFHI